MQWITFIYIINSILLDSLGWADNLPVHLNLEKCIEIGIKNAVNLLHSENNLSVLGAQLLQSYGRFLPNFNIAADYDLSSGKALYTFSGANLVDSTSTNANLTVSSSLNLFNGLGDFSNLKSILAKKGSLISSIAWVKQKVALDITQSYFQIILDQELLNISEKNLAVSQGRLMLLQAQVRIGSAALADLYREKAQVSSDQFSFMNNENRYINDKLLLLRKLRIDLEKLYLFDKPDLSPNVAELSKQPVELLIQKALGERSDIHSYKLALESADWAITQAKSLYYPRLDLALSRNAVGHYLREQFVNGNNTLPVFQRDLLTQLSDQATFTVTLGLTWNIFNQFSTQSSVESARAAFRDAQVDYDDLKFQAQSEIRIAFNNYKLSQKQLSASQIGLKAAEQAFEMIEGRYKVGINTFIDLLVAQASLVQAQSNHAQALISLKLQEKTLQYVTGCFSF